MKITFRASAQGWLSALVPDDAVVGLSRELILQSIYTLRLPSAPMGLVVDAGAHVGLYSLMMSQQAERVVSLEADPVNFRILDLNVFRSGASNVTALNSALWSETGSISFARTGFTEWVR